MLNLTKADFKQFNQQPDFWGAISQILPVIQPELTRLLSEKTLIPSQSIVVADWDGSLAFKSEEDFDHAALLNWEYKNIQNLAPQYHRYNILTASGEERILRFLAEHVHSRADLLANITLYSNFGYVVHLLDKPRLRDENQQPIHTYIEIPGFSRYERETVTAATHSFVGDVAKKFAGHSSVTLTEDYRQMTGTVIYEMPVDPVEMNAFLELNPGRTKQDFNSIIHQEFNQYADAMCKRAEKLHGVAPTKGIKLARLSRLITRNGRDFIQGYIDAGIAAAHKGVPAAIILREQTQGVKNTGAIGIFDSSSDVPAAIEIAKFLPKQNRINICIGDGLRGQNEIYKQQTGEDLIDVFLTRQHDIEPVRQGHALMAAFTAVKAQSPNANGRYAPKLVIGSGT